MREQEVQEWMDSMWPINGERWVKLKFHDQDKSRDVIRLHSIPERLEAHIKKYGFEVTAHGFSDEFSITIQALFQLKNDLTINLYGRVDESVVKFINRAFDEKAFELQKRNTTTINPLE